MVVCGVAGLDIIAFVLFNTDDAITLELAGKIIE